MDLAGKLVGVGLLKHLNFSARLELENRYTEHDRLAPNSNHVTLNGDNMPGATDTEKYLKDES